MKNLVDKVLASPKLGITCDIPGWDEVPSVNAALERCRREHCELYGVLWDRQNEWEVAITSEGVSCTKSDFEMTGNQDPALRLVRLVTHENEQLPETSMTLSGRE
ncbi:MAG TPA: hypothetical protein VGE39_00065 [Prosthecobacter sp.]